MADDWYYRKLSYGDNDDYDHASFHVDDPNAKTVEHYSSDSKRCKGNQSTKEKDDDVGTSHGNLNVNMPSSNNSYQVDDFHLNDDVNYNFIVKRVVTKEEDQDCGTTNDYDDYVHVVVHVNVVDANGQVHVSRHRLEDLTKEDNVQANAMDNSMYGDHQLP